MSMTQQAIQYGKRRVTRKLLRAVPWLGAVVALVTFAATVRRKGVYGGTLDTALDFLPYVGGVKNAAEIVRGRDFIKDKRPSAV